MDVNLTKTKRKQNITKKKHLEYIYDRKVTTTSTSHIPRKKRAPLLLFFIFKILLIHIKFFFILRNHNLYITLNNNIYAWSCKPNFKWFQYSDVNVSDLLSYEINMIFKFKIIGKVDWMLRTDISNQLMSDKWIYSMNRRKTTNLSLLQYKNPLGQYCCFLT